MQADGCPQMELKAGLDNMQTKGSTMLQPINANGSQGSQANSFLCSASLLRGLMPNPGE